MSSLVRCARTGSRVLQRTCQNSRAPKRKMGDFSGDTQYRGELPKIPKWIWNLSAFPTWICVTWIGVMTYRHFGHIIGEFPEVYPEQLTDEELGIPPDDEDIYPPNYKPVGPGPVRFY